MTDPLRRRPYVWPTWISKLLAGEAKCWYSSWVKATRRYKKLVDPERAEFLARWTVGHDKMVQARAAEMKKDGWNVRVEDEGEFKLEGKTADLSGKPDLVGIRDGIALAIDAKSGKRRLSDHWQVLIYLFALPLSWLRGHKELHGEVLYKDGAEKVRPLTPEIVAQIADAIRKVSDVSNPPPAVPSSFECGRCDVASCRERHQKPKPGNAKEFF